MARVKPVGKGRENNIQVCFERAGKEWLFVLAEEADLSMADYVRNLIAEQVKAKGYDMNIKPPDDLYSGVREAQQQHLFQKVS
jgi:hypothetical protein